MSGASSVTLGETYENTSAFNDVDNLLGLGQWNIKRGDVYKTIKLENTEDMFSEGEVIKFSYLEGIVGKNGAFKERGDVDNNGDCNLVKYKDLLNPDKGVYYTVADDGEVVLEYFYSGTDHLNPFGYFYTDADATFLETAQATRYMITESTLNKNWLKIDGGASTGYLQFASAIQDWEDNQNDHTVQGTKIRLVYFDEEGNASWDFPKGTKIYFFVITGNTSEITWGNTRFSTPQLNKAFGATRNSEAHPSFTAIDPAEGVPNFITYKYYGNVIMGLEDDGGDDDMNDLLFYVSNVETTGEDEITEIGEEVEAQSWLLAAEDLGNIGDFDFNDVVVKVSHVSGETTAKVQALAAGGTLPVWLTCGTGTTADTEVEGPNNETEFHSWFGDGLINESTMINTGNGSETAALCDAVEINVDEDFLMSAGQSPSGGNMGGFSIKVERDNGIYYTVTPPQNGDAPQMICVPEDWKWPLETTNISKAYPSFGDWGSNYTTVDWVKGDDVNTGLLY